MSQAVITKIFSEWKAQQAVDNKSIVLDEFVFAYIPDLDVNKPISNTETTPAADKIVHSQAVSKCGVVNDNSVVYSITLGADVGDFDFNWIGLTNKATGTLAMIIHAPVQSKVKNASGQQGNVLVRSMLMEYSGAQAATEITTPAETWQIDFTARLAAMDERQRLGNVDQYGPAAFFGEGYLVAKSGAKFLVTKGSGYVAGLRTTLDENQDITISTKPIKVWLDVSWTGTLTSAWGVQQKITVADTLADYEQGGVQHFVFALASIDAAGVITDLRPQGSLNEQKGNSDFLRKDKNLSDVADKASARNSLELKSSALREVGIRLGDVMEVGAGRLLAGTFVSAEDDAKSIGARAATGCQFIRAYKAPDAPDQVNYWQVITMTDVASPTSQVVVLAITTTTNAFAVGYGTGKGITMWRSIPALEGAAFSGNISAPNIVAEFQVKAGEAIFRSDGDIYGSTWGSYGRLSGYLTGTFTKKTEVDEWLSAKPDTTEVAQWLSAKPDTTEVAQWLSAKPDTTEVAQWLSAKPDRQFITQVGLYQSDKTKPYMLHDDGTGVFLATKDMLSIASLGMTGWHKDNSTGLITQWGEVNTSQAAFRVDFPLAFPNACFGVTVSDRSSFSAVGTSNRNTNGFDLNSSFNGTTNSFYIAKGI
ncbi:TPA: phage tail protein [Citrobacter freundii]